MPLQNVMRGQALERKKTWYAMPDSAQETQRRHSGVTTVEHEENDEEEKKKKTEKNESTNKLSWI